MRRLNDIVIVDGVETKIISIERHDGEMDYLLRPLDASKDLCKCKSRDCCGSAWYFERDIVKNELENLYEI